MFKIIVKNLLKLIDKLIYNFLSKNVEIMPLRFKKLIANFYTDARIRKLYWEELGIKFGENSYPNLGLILCSDGTNKPIVHVGKNVSIAPNVIFVSNSLPNNSNFLMNLDYVKNKLTKNLPIIIEDDVWIGANVTILPGVTIKKGSIIGAGSLVLKDIEPFSIYAGTPAKKINSIEENITKEKNA